MIEPTPQVPDPPPTAAKRALSLGAGVVRAALLLFAGLVAIAVVGGLIAYFAQDHGVRFRVGSSCPNVLVDYADEHGLRRQYRVATPWESPLMQYPEGVEVGIIASQDMGCEQPVECHIVYNGSVAISQSGPVAVCRALNR